MSRFESLQLRPEIVKACRKQGFDGPTPIQSLVVPVVASGRDAVVEAKTGSGKTLAYGLALLDREPLQALHPETLVLCPTRELAEQVAAELTRTAGVLPRPVALLTGGGNMDKQRRALTEGAVIAVGTLGRIEELLQRGWVDLSHLRTLVLDEVDELLRGGFSGNLAALLGSLPRDRQTLLFSATVPTEVEAVARQFTRRPERLRLTVAREAPAELRHRVLFTSVDDRLANLVGYLRAERPYQSLIFCGTRHETEELREALDAEGLQAEFLHGELSPLKRRQLLDHFRTGDLPVLVASDLAARGLDLPGVDLIVNYSLPTDTAAYLHRAGRTGRAGRPGVVLSLIIGQQHTRFERLKQSFTFESMEVSSRGKVFSHPTRTQEERDRLFGKAPPRLNVKPSALAAPQGADRPRRGDSLPGDRAKRGDDTRAAGRPEGRSGSRSAPRQDARSASRSDVRPVSRSEAKSGARAGARTAVSGKPAPAAGKAGGSRPSQRAGARTSPGAGARPTGSPRRRPSPRRGR